VARTGLSPEQTNAVNHTLVLGLGNPILTDDGVGVKVAERVRDALPPDAPVTVTEVSVGGLTLMEAMVGYDRVILVDAMQREGLAPGAVERLTLDDLRAISPTQHSASPHDANLVTALETGRRMGLHLPEEIVIYGVGVVNVLDFGDAPTPAVAAAIPVAAAAVLAELGCVAIPDAGGGEPWSHPN
jgi:hydrogenase maturation protease